MAEAYDAVEVIVTKRDGRQLSDDQIDWVLDAYTDCVTSIASRQRQASSDPSPPVAPPDEGAAAHHLCAAAQRSIQTCCRREDYLVGKPRQIQEGCPGQLQPDRVVDGVVAEVASSVPTKVSNHGGHCACHVGAPLRAVRHGFNH